LALITNIILAFCEGVGEENMELAGEALRLYGELLRMIEKNGLERVRDQLQDYLIESIRIRPEKMEDFQIKVGESKLGGMPDLPPYMEWPGLKERRFAFIAQLKLGDLTELDKKKVLPSKGWLYFFYDTDEKPWGLRQENREHWKVLYYDGELKSLQRTAFPVEVPATSRFFPYRLKFQGEVTLPSCYSLFFEKLKQESRFNPAEEDAYCNLKEDLAAFYGDNGDYPAYRLLGYSDNIQGDMRLECERTSRGMGLALKGLPEQRLVELAGDTQQWIYLLAKDDASTCITLGTENEKSLVLPRGEPQDSGYQRAAELLDDVLQWILLLQVDSDSNENMMWGDCGRLYFWIPRKALQNKDFDQVWTILQC
jgi:uncharacterized protein YwqG